MPWVSKERLDELCNKEVMLRVADRAVGEIGSYVRNVLYGRESNPRLTREEMDGIIRVADLATTDAFLNSASIDARWMRMKYPLVLNETLEPPFWGMRAEWGKVLIDPRVKPQIENAGVEDEFEESGCAERSGFRPAAQSDSSPHVKPQIEKAGMEDEFEESERAEPWAKDELKEQSSRPPLVHNPNRGSRFAFWMDAVGLLLMLLWLLITFGRQQWWGYLLAALGASMITAARQMRKETRR